ncbi:MAG: YgiT-type zinc finger protein [Spirochaetota bacterium]|nr:YgiT-type zinc finger protein [Spirochaetota bacterium]
MKGFSQCPLCGGDVTDKEVDKLLWGGNDTADIKVSARVCLKCGERMYDEKTILRFEEIRKKLKEHDTGDFKAVGQFYHVG